MDFNQIRIKSDYINNKEKKIIKKYDNLKYILLKIVFCYRIFENLQKVSPIWTQINKNH